MILVDISSILHRMIFGSTRDTSRIRTKNGKYITEDFISLTLYYIVSELIDIQLKYKDYGEMIICFDDYKKAYWRRDVYPNYKKNRKNSREATSNPINYSEVYSYSNKLFENIQKHTPWRCVYVNRAEADDVILVLAKEFLHEKILILSPDKDFIQAQRYPNIKQYSSLTKKWIYPENKSTDMSEWIFEHVFLGDASDNVPKVTDFTEFSDSFLEHLKKYNTENKKEIPLTVKAFKELSEDTIRDIMNTYDIKLYNKRGEDIGYDIYKNRRFGPSDVKKIVDGTHSLNVKKEKINKDIITLRAKKRLCESVQARKEIQTRIKELQETIKSLKIEPKSVEERVNEFLDSHELYREHYERNFTLVMEEGIPDYIRANTIMEYRNSNTTYNEEEFCNYLDSVNLGAIKSKLPKIFSTTTELDITNCGW